MLFRFNLPTWTRTAFTGDGVIIRMDGTTFPKVDSSSLRARTASRKAHTLLWGLHIVPLKVRGPPAQSPSPLQLQLPALP